VTDLRLFDFSEERDIARWHAVDDRVMGGVSDSRVQRCSPDSAAFAGVVSLENNGGFASVHAAIPQGILAGHVAIALDCVGDGRRYSLRLRQDEAFDGISYRNDFTPAAGQVSRILLPLADFVPVFRGRTLTTAGPLEPASVRRIGLLIAGQQAGEFKLELHRVSAVKPARV